MYVITDLIGDENESFALGCEYNLVIELGFATYFYNFSQL